jgi:hypothetical protein
MEVSCCKFEAMDSRARSIELSVICLGCSTRWYGFERHVPMRLSRGGRKLPWITTKLSCLKNKKTKAAKRWKASKKRCLEDGKIDECECEQLRREFL